MTTNNKVFASVYVSCICSHDQSELPQAIRSSLFSKDVLPSLISSVWFKRKHTKYSREGAARTDLLMPGEISKKKEKKKGSSKIRGRKQKFGKSKTLNSMGKVKTIKQTNQYGVSIRTAVPAHFNPAVITSTGSRGCHHILTDSD